MFVISHDVKEITSLSNVIKFSWPLKLLHPMEFFKLTEWKKLSGC